MKLRTLSTQYMVDLSKDEYDLLAPYPTEENGLAPLGVDDFESSVVGFDPEGFGVYKQGDQYTLEFTLNGGDELNVRIAAVTAVIAAKVAANRVTRETNRLIDALKTDHEGIASEMEISKSIYYLKNKEFEKVNISTFHLLHRINNIVPAMLILMMS